MNDDHHLIETLEQLEKTLNLLAAFIAQQQKVNDSIVAILNAQHGDDDDSPLIPPTL